MKPTSGLLAIAGFACLHLSVMQAQIPVRFELSVDPTGVALQFDITSALPLSAIGTPQFEGASAHTVRSATLASGAHRFVVYSQDGDAISAAGEVRVTIPMSLAQDDGAITIGNVTASNASGQVVAATPNALPALKLQTRDHQSFEVGSSWEFGDAVVDIDGQITEIRLLSGTEEIDAATTQPLILNWSPAATGSYQLSLHATDNLDRSTELDLGTFRAYDQGQISDYNIFAEVHYGNAAPGSTTAFDADPLGNGIANGLAFLLGLNPHKPDRSRLPQVVVERSENGAELVLRFIRRSNLAGIAWQAASSSDMRSFDDIASELATETDRGDGTHTVEFRMPVSSESKYAQFINLTVDQP